MSISSFVQTAIGTILRRDELSSSCESVAKKIREGILPEYQHAVELFGNITAKSAEIKLYESQFKRRTGKAKLFQSVIDGFESGLQQLDHIADLSVKIFADEEPSAGLTFKKATYVRMVAGIGFAADYSIRLLNWLYATEEDAVGQVHAEDQFSKHEREYIEQYFESFCVVYKAMLVNVKNLQKLVEDMPDIAVNESVEHAATANLGIDKIDPLMLNNLVSPVKVSVKWNPFYLIGTIIASWQTKAYKATEDELKLLQMRRAHLEKLRRGESDPALERDIAMLADRIAVLTYELQNAKVKYGL
jgi:hypothetical protein